MKGCCVEVAVLWFVFAALGFAAPASDPAGLPPTARVRPSNADGSAHQAEVRLISEGGALVPGSTARIGVELIPDPHWHAYWKFPGEVGEPLSVEWSLPAGLSARGKGHPVPIRFSTDGIVSYGYDGAHLLVFDVDVPSDATGTLSLAAETRWLVCAEVCIPGEARVALDLPIASAATATAQAPAFAAALSELPTPMAEVSGLAVEAALSQSAVRPNDEFKAVFRIVSTDGSPLGADVEAGTWPVFVPMSDPYSTYVKAAEIVRPDATSAVVTLTLDAYGVDPLPTDATVGGLIQVRLGDQVVRTEVTTPLPWAPAGAQVTPSTSPLWALGGATPAGPDRAPVEPPAPPPVAGSLFSMLGLAFLGGLLLNVMPCVLPVLTLKLFGLVEHSGAGAARQRSAGLAYTAGVLTSFAALGASVVALKATVGSVGWGFQFQSPLYVAALTTVVFVFGLSLFGVYEIPALGADAASKASSGSGVASDFLNGVFATLLATPCSAPFLGSAVGFAFSQPAPVIAGFFLVVGLGLASPFLVVSFVPALFRFLPRPGAWMETFKHLMGFTLMGTAVWLLGVLASHVGPDRVIGFLGFLAIVGVSAWIFGHWGGVEQTRSRQGGALGAAAAVAVAGGWYFIDLEAFAEPVCDDVAVTDASFDEAIPWRSFSGPQVEAPEAPTFVDFTASWCLTCKFNERTVLETAEVRAAMEKCGMVPLKADWTRRDEEITAWLARYGRAGVPFYLVVPPSGPAEAIVLPEVITVASVVGAIEQACS
jgi:thiol:disulfide interchange protein/DsbC/DsbD-like thiol-disulfide interchange protein